MNVSSSRPGVILLQEARSCVSLLEEEGMTGCVEENGACENRKLEGLRRPECVVDVS